MIERWRAIELHAVAGSHIFAPAPPAFGHNALRAKGLADFGVGLFDLEQTSQIFVVFYGAVEVLVASARGSSSTT